MRMAISVLAAAKWLGQKSNWSLSNLELQKLIYLAHMFFLGRTGKPLVSGVFEAWDYGPVHPTLYHVVKMFGARPVENIFGTVPDLEDGEEKSILGEAYDVLGGVGASRLVAATHRKDGAWDKNYIPGQRHCIILNSDILHEYNNLRKEG
jgi:uncharacterized phage-associated protein